MHSLPSFKELRPVCAALHDGDVQEAARRYREIGPSFVVDAEQVVAALEGIRQSLSRSDREGAIEIYQRFAGVGFGEAQAVVESLEPRLFEAPCGRFVKLSSWTRRKPTRAKLKWLLTIHSLNLLCMLAIGIAEGIRLARGGAFDRRFLWTVLFVAVFSGACILSVISQLRGMAKRQSA
jgi:hypothetical protein